MKCYVKPKHRIGNNIYLVRAWKAIGDRSERPCYLSRVDHDRKIRSRKQKTDIGKYSFVNRTIQLWNQLPADVLGTLSCKLSNFRKRVRKVISEVKCGDVNGT
jgi:hypothetical protein